MRVGAYDPTVQMCKNCLAWKRASTPRAGKFSGLCRHDPPKVTHLRSVIPQQGPSNQVQMSVVDAESSGWPTTMEDDSCFQHVAVLAQ
jgi:hypothetical protein